MKLIVISQCHLLFISLSYKKTVLVSVTLLGFAEKLVFMNSIVLSLPGISSLDSKASGKMGMRAVVYYMVTTLIAVFIGIVMVIIIRPGKGSRDNPVSSSGNIEPVQAADAFLDLIRFDKQSCNMYCTVLYCTYISKNHI